MTASPMRVLAIDWSGAKRAPARKRWVAEASSGQLVDVRRGATTEQMAADIIRLAGEGPLIVGLDFAFSFPAWFVREQLEAVAAQDVWAAAVAEGESWLADSKPPFWGRKGTKRPPTDASRPQLRRTDQESPYIAKSVFQVNGGGAVGTGSVRGMPLLSRLSAGGFSAWPFQDATDRTVIEIYPRLLTKAVVKSSKEAREEYLRRDGRVPAELLQVTASDEDPFDAAISALEIASHVDEIRALRFEADYALEGAIWRPGWQPRFTYLDPGLPSAPFVFDYPDGSGEGVFLPEQVSVAPDGTVTVAPELGTPRVLRIIDFKDGWLVSRDGAGERWKLRVRRYPGDS